MINPFIIKKWGALLLVGFLSVLGFFIVLKFKGFTWALGGMAIGLFLGMLIANALLWNPFTAMLEGQGILMLDLNSTGIIRPFIMTVDSPYVKGRFDNKLHEDIFDRDMVYNIAIPQKTGYVQQGEGKDGKVRTALILDEDDYNKGRFGMLQYPCILYNSQLNTVLTKDFLSSEEKTSFAEHQVLYLNKKVEQLTDAMLNFGRYVVESLRPNKLNLGTWGIVIIIGAIVVLIILFGPQLLAQLQQAGTGLGIGGTKSPIG